MKSDCAKTVSPADNALWKFMVNRGRDFFPKIEHVAIGRKRSDRSSARPAGDKRFPDRLPNRYLDLGASLCHQLAGVVGHVLGGQWGHRLEKAVTEGELPATVSPADLARFYAY